jgi:PAS domain S-box-containing protein
MQNTEAVLQDVFDTISTGIFVIDVESVSGTEQKILAFRFVSNNPAYARMLSIPTATLVGLYPHECFPPDIADKFCANYTRCVEQRRPISYEEVFEFETHSCTLLTTLFPKLEQDGKILRIIGSSQDITERKQVEEKQKRVEKALSKDKELLSTLIENAPVGIISTDESGEILLVNPAFEIICGYSEEELVGQQPPYPYWDLADLEEIYHEFGQAMSGKKEHIELWFTRKNGQRFLARLKPITIFDAQGNMLRHLATMEDITKYKQAEEELFKALETERELNEIKSRFVAMVSHEYRTPLMTISSSAELLERYNQQFTEEQKLKHYSRIQTSVRALNELVSDILTISKIEAGRQEFNPITLDLDKFCRELVEELQQTMGSQHTLVFTSQGNPTSTTHGTTAIASAYMDEKLLQYIISNLLSNAIKYSPEGSKVQFNLAYDQAQAILRIQDEGIGIPQEDQQHLFKSFHRGCNVRSISGTGLGLAIVKNSVELQGGQIAVTSEVGVGTTFTVTLPLNHHVTTKEDGACIFRNSLS